MTVSRPPGDRLTRPASSSAAIASSPSTGPRPARDERRVALMALVERVEQRRVGRLQLGATSVGDRALAGPVQQVEHVLGVGDQLGAAPDQRMWSAR